ncbi:MAG: hypothetical protein ABIE22_02240 [archaeon]
MDPARVEVYKVNTEDMLEALEKKRVLARSNGDVLSFVDLSQMGLLSLVSDYSLCINGRPLDITIFQGLRPEIIASWSDRHIKTGATYMKQAKFDFNSLEAMAKFPAFHYLRIMYQIIDPPLRN